MDNNKKCFWCLAEEVIGELNLKEKGFPYADIYYCSPEHKENIIKYSEFYLKHISLYNKAVIASLILYPFLIFFFQSHIALITLIFSLDVGVGYYIMPVVPDFFIKTAGLKGGLFLTRIFSIFAIGAGFTVFILYYA